ncbi:hypothetical protein M422DRAFT_25381 [Sphaerobolus stellatus SS14]|nr:hypothetical protein M422DRAFT_25381 [Sphaerobolus stellatus SS14]
MPKLKILCIYWDSSYWDGIPDTAPEMGKFFRVLRAPQVEYLHLAKLHYGDELITHLSDGIFSIFTFFPAVIPLRSLRMTNVDFPTDKLLPFLPRMPHLENLCIQEQFTSPAFMEALGRKDNAPYLLPKLGDISFRMSHIHGGHIVAMVKARMEIATQEKLFGFRIDLKDASGIGDDEAQALADLQVAKWNGVLPVEILLQ